MNRVLVLLSSYNGAMYIEEQINSLLNQEGVLIEILIRDDCSVDETVEIIKKVSKRTKNIKLISGGKNLGYMQSFKYLIDHAKNLDFDFLAFCDQDDVWKKDKLLKSIELLNKLDNRKPLCYSSNLIIVDNSLRYLKEMYMPGNYPNMKKITSLIFRGSSYGCTLVLNRQAFNKINFFNGEDIYPFDYYIPIIVGLTGENIFDDVGRILYRQHDNNEIGANRSLLKQFKRINKRYNLNYYSVFSKKIMKDYLNDLSAKDFVLLNMIQNYDKSLINKLNILKEKEVSKKTLKGTLLLKTMILMNKF